MRPVLAQPPLCSIADLKTVLTIDDLADMHEALNVREMAVHVQRAQAKTNRK